MTDVFRQEYKPLSDDQKAKMNEIKENAEELWDVMNWEHNADPRMLALAKTNLEQAVMWAIKSIT